MNTQELNRLRMQSAAYAGYLNTFADNPKFEISMDFSDPILGRISLQTKAVTHGEGQATYLLKSGKVAEEHLDFGWFRFWVVFDSLEDWMRYRAPLSRREFMTVRRTKG